MTEFKFQSLLQSRNVHAVLMVIVFLLGTGAWDLRLDGLPSRAFDFMYLCICINQLLSHDLLNHQLMLHILHLNVIIMNCQYCTLTNLIEVRYPIKCNFRTCNNDWLGDLKYKALPLSSVRRIAFWWSTMYDMNVWFFQMTEILAFEHGAANKGKLLISGVYAIFGPFHCSTLYDTSNIRIFSIQFSGVLLEEPIWTDYKTSKAPLFVFQFPRNCYKCISIKVINKFTILLWYLFHCMSLLLVPVMSKNTFNMWISIMALVLVARIEFQV